MAIKPGVYKLYYDISYDGGATYPYTDEGFCIVYISDTNPGSEEIVNDDGNLTRYAEAILTALNMRGKSFVFNKIYNLGTFLSQNAIDIKRVEIINWYGIADISISIPNTQSEQITQLSFNVYTDKEKSKLLGSGYKKIGAGADTQLLNIAWLGWYDLETSIPVMAINNANTTLYSGYIYGYSRGNRTPGTCRVGYQYGSQRNAFLAAFDGVEPWLEDTDPYSEIDPSAPAGGDGTFDFSSTPIDFQGLPGIGAYQTGMIDLYVPSAAQLQALSNYLWAGAFDLDNFRKIVADPMDAILGLSIVPVTAAEIGTGSGVLAVGNISTGITMPTASRQYVSVDCGSVSILPKYGAYLDFAPYCKLQLFLPYIGYVQISPDDCMNGAISVRYSVDILSGMCVAQVKCNDHVLYELAGSCSCQCPVTAGQYQNIALTALRVASAGAMTGAALAAGSVGGVTGGIEDAANSIISSVKPEIERSGGFGGSSGLMGHQVPYLILTIPRMCRPLRQNQIIGYPSFVTVTLGDITGYAAVAEIHLRGIPGASDEDLTEIETLLKEGVYL